MKKKVAITGPKGTIGTVLTKHLKANYTIIPLSRPELDVTHYSKLKSATQNCDVIIHLALEKEVGFRNENMNPNDFITTFNVFKAAVENKIPRLIIASSIHADDYTQGDKRILKNPYALPYPDSPYGALKVYGEALGRFYAKKGLEVVCIRFGGVNKEDRTDLDEKDYKSVYFSHRDCVGLITTIINAPKIPGNYQIIYGVSNNKKPFHDWTNVLGWVPQDSA